MNALCGNETEENAQVFSFAIEPADMAELDTLNEDLVVGWRPNGWQGEV